MAKGGKQTQNTSDSIFNFIFSSAKKNVRDSKPPEPSGATGNEMADGLMEVAAMPATYASEQVFTPMEEILDNTVLAGEKVRIDSKNEVGVKITAKDFSDPNAALEKSLAKTEETKAQAKKLNMIRGIGGAMDMAVGAIATKRLMRREGIDSAKAMQIGRELGNEYMKQEKRNEKAQEKASIGATYQTFMDSDLEDKEVDNIGKMFNGALDESKFKRSETMVEVKRQAKEYASQFSDREAARQAELEYMRNHGRQAVGRDIKGYLDKYTQNMNITEEQKNSLVDNYMDFEERRKPGTIGSESWDLGNSGLEKQKGGKLNFSPETLEEDFRKSDDPADRFRALKYDELKSKRLFYAQQLNRLDPNDPRYQEYIDKLGEVEKESRILEIWQRSNGSDMKFTRLLGEANLTMSSFRNMTSAEGGLVAIMNGKFYDDNFNKWNPTKEVDGLKVAKSDDSKRGVLGTRSQRFLTGLHYFTPASMARTMFVNGEGFEYLAYVRERNLKNLIRRNDQTMLDLVTDDAHKEAFRNLGISVDNREQALQDIMDNYSDTLGELKSRMDDGRISSETGEKLVNKLTKMEGKLKGSWTARYARKLQGFWKKFKNSKWNPANLYNRFFRGTLKWTLTVFMGRRLASRVANSLVGGTAAIRTIIRAGVRKAVHAITQALGLALGGAANALIFVLTEIGVWLAEKLLKPVARVATFLFFGIPLVVFFLIMAPIVYFDSLNPFSSTSREFDTASAAAPIYCEECEGVVQDEHGPFPGESPPEFALEDIPEGGFADDVVYYHQNDSRWGGQSYGSSTIGLGGCGPASLAMVVDGLTGSEETPLQVARWAERNGHRVDGVGSAWTLMTHGGSHYGLNVTTAQSPAQVRTALERDNPVIISMGPGDFTSVGHFIVLVGLEDGQIRVHDPYSVSRTEQLWDFDNVMAQSRINRGGAWIYY